eukprot:261832-Pelagomonas_calceolata.AAC.1
MCEVSASPEYVRACACTAYEGVLPGDTAWRRLTSPPLRSALAIRPRAFRKEPPNGSHRQRASLCPPRPQEFDPGTSSLLSPSSRLTRAP